MKYFAHLIDSKTGEIIHTSNSNSRVVVRIESKRAKRLYGEPSEIYIYKKGTITPIEKI